MFGKNIMQIIKKYYPRGVGVEIVEKNNIL
jgi:hypothetical protein